MQNKINMKDKITLTFSFLAILISVISLCKSCEQTDISKNNYYLNIDPILRTNFDLDIIHRKYALKFHNDGSNSIIDIKMRKSFGLFCLKSEEFGIRVDSPIDSIVCKKIEPGGNFEIELKYQNFKSTFYLLDTINDSLNLFIPFQSYYISYKRPPDRKTYYINKYLLLLTNSKRKSIFPTDPESIWGRSIIEIKRAMEKNDTVANIVN